MPKKRSILFTIPTLGAGGAERVLIRLLNYWAEHTSWELILLTHDPMHQEPFYSIHESIQLVRTGAWNGIKKGLIPFHIHRAVKKFQPDLIVSFIFVNNLLTLLGNIFSKTPCIISERLTPSFFHKSILQFLRDKLYKHAHLITTQTKRAQEMLPDFLRRKTVVIPNPVDVEDLEIQNSVSKTIIAVGRLHAQKGFDVLIEAFAKVASIYSDWQLELWGDGPQRDMLHTLIRSKNLEGQIMLKGTTQNILQEMAHAEFFVLSSRWEGIPNVLCEAMALGMPVIATDCPTGPRELITDGEDGLLVPVGDVGAMANAIVKLIQDKELRQQLGAKAKTKMKQYDTATIAKLWAREFDKVLKG